MLVGTNEQDRNLTNMRIATLLLILFALPVMAQEESPSAVKPPAVLKDNKYKLDPSVEPFRSIRDNAPFPWMLKTKENNPENLHEYRMEENAYDDVLRHAAQFTNADLEQNARRDVTFQDLLLPGRLSYKLDLIYFEGRLRRLRKVDVTQSLKDAGIEAVYEAWIFPKDETTPMCVILTQLPPGVEPQKDLSKDPPNVWVGVAGFSFKLLQYEQQKLDRGTVGKHALWVAPVLIGKSLTVIPEPEVNDGGMAWRTTFAPFVVFGFATVALSLLYLAWRFRRGDQLVKDATSGIRNKNPFEDVQE
ncbi:hypothetical protein BH11PLA2_BH11PLA2_28120 [soil metagenome]